MYQLEYQKTNMVQNARNASHFIPKNIVTGSISTPILYNILFFSFPPNPYVSIKNTIDTIVITLSARRKMSNVRRNVTYRIFLISGLWYGGSSIMSPTLSSFGASEFPYTLYTINIIRNINANIEIIIINPPVLPKSAIASTSHTSETSST